MLHVVVDVVASGWLSPVAFLFAWHSFEIHYLLKVLVSTGFSLNLQLVWSIPGAQHFGYADLSSRKTVNCIIVVHGIVQATGWAVHGTWHGWVYILPECNFLAVALNTYSYYLFSAGVNQYCQIVLMQLCCGNCAVSCESGTEELKSLKLTVKISRREYLLKESKSLANCVKITGWINKESVCQWIPYFYREDMSDYSFKILVWILKAGTRMHLLLYMDTQPKKNLWLSFRCLEDSDLNCIVVWDFC